MKIAIPEEELFNNDYKILKNTCIHIDTLHVVNTTFFSIHIKSVRRLY